MKSSSTLGASRFFVRAGIILAIASSLSVALIGMRGNTIGSSVEKALNLLSLASSEETSSSLVPELSMQPLASSSAMSMMMNCAVSPCLAAHTTLIEIDDLPICGIGSTGFEGDVQNGQADCIADGLNCHVFKVYRDMNSISQSFMLEVGQGNGCNGELDLTLSQIGGICDTLSNGGSNTSIMFTFPNSVDTIFLFFCINSGAFTTICDMCRVGVADLSLDKSLTYNQPTNEVTFTVTVSNDGTDDATGVFVTDSLPDGYSYVSHVTSQGTYNPVNGLWNVGTIANPGSATLTIVATVNSMGDYLNIAQITSVNEEDEDSDPGTDENNDDFGDGIPDDDEDQAGIDVFADLSLTKIVDNNAPIQGANITFTITVTNDGILDATGVVVADLLPVGLDYVSDMPSAGSYDDMTGIWTIGALLNGASVTLDIVATATGVGMITNFAEITGSDQTDLDSDPTQSFNADDLSDMVADDDEDSVPVNILEELVVCGPCMITGPASVCPASVDTFIVSVDECLNPVYTWSVTNGAVISSGQGNDTITVTAPGMCNVQYVVMVSIECEDCDVGTTPVICSDTVSVEDLIPPTISCPDNIVLDCNSPVDPGTTGMPTMLSDNCSSVLEATFTDVEEGDACELLINRTWSVMDDCGNVTTCLQRITLSDTTDPVCPTPPADELYTCLTLVPLPGDLTATDDCQVDITVAGSDTDNAGAGCIGDTLVITRTWTFDDGCGNTCEVSQEIRVVDSVLPIFDQSCPNDTTVNCNAIPSAPTLTATDNCGTADVVPSEDSTLGTDGPCEYTISRTWIATDECGNTAECVQIITVVDTTAPVCPTPPNDTLYTCVSLVPLPGDLTATDACQVDITVTGVDSDNGGAGCSVNPLIITRTWLFDDGCGNTCTVDQTITVADTIRPMIVCPEDVTIDWPGGDPEDAFQLAVAQCEVWMEDFSATDNCTAEVLTNVDADLNFLCVEDFGPFVKTVRFYAEDECGNLTSCTRYFTVQDTTPPVIVCPIDASVECGLVPPPAPETVIATDNFGIPTVEFLGDMVSTAQCPTVIIRKYKATDSCMNMTTCTQRIVVDDNTPPMTTNCDPGADLGCLLTPSQYAADDFPTWTDNCGVPTSGVVTGVPTNTSGCAWSVTHRYWAVDACSNSDTCYQTFTWIEDSTPPMTTNCDPGADLGCLLTPSQYAADDFPTWTDDCGVPTSGVVTGVPTNTSNCSWSVTHRYWALDACLNSDTCYQTFTWIEDSTPPSITAPENEMVECGDVVVFNDPIVTDNCQLTDLTFSDMSGSSIFETLSGSQEVPPNASTATGTLIGGYDDATNMLFFCVEFSGLSAPATAAHIHIAPVGVNGPVIIPLPVPLAGSGNFCYSGVISPADETALLAGGLYINIHTSIFPGGELRSQLAVDCGQTVKRTWTATDTCGNVAMASAFVQFVDTTPPAPLACPPAVDLGCNPLAIPEPELLTTVDDCDGVLTATLLPSDIIAVGCERFLTRTYIATDACGNTATCTQYFTWTVDTTPPSLTCIAEPIFVFECTPGQLPAPPGVVAADDNCSGSVSYFFDGKYYSLTSPGTWQDVRNEALSLGGDLVAINNAAENAFLGATFAQFGTAWIGYTDETTEGTYVWINGDPSGFENWNVGEPNNVGDEDYTEISEFDGYWNDAVGTSIRPGIIESLIPSETMVSVDTMATDTLECQGRVIYLYTASDACGNTAQCTQVVFYPVDSTPPQITNCDDITVTDYCFTVVDLEDPLQLSLVDDVENAAEEGVFADAVDNCDIDFFDADAYFVGEATDGCGFVVRVEYFAIDECGNSTSCTQLITVLDQVAPMLTAPVDVTVDCSAIGGDLGTAVVIDDCDPEIFVTYMDLQCEVGTEGFTGDYDFTNWTIYNELDGQVITSGNSMVTFISADAGNCNDAVSRFSIVVPADGKLVFSWNYDTGDGPQYDPFGYRVNGVYVQLTNDTGNNQQAGIGAAMVSAGDVFAFEQQSVDCIFGAGTTTVVDFFSYTCTELVQPVCNEPFFRCWSATDACGNTSYALQRVTIEDNIPPTLICPQDVTGECAGGVVSPRILYSVSADDALLRELDPTTGNTLSSIAITLLGETVLYATGLATHPETNVLYAILQLSGGGSSRRLATVDPISGIATSIGNTGLPLAGIAFRGNGVLYGIAGDGAGGGNAESLFTINISNGVPTSVVVLGNGDFGETIAYNPTDDLMYHLSGDASAVFESIDLDALTVTNITLSGADYGEGRGVTYDNTTGGFLVTGGPFQGTISLYNLTTTGVSSLIGSVDGRIKGLAFVGGESSGAPVPDPGLVMASDNCDQDVFVTFLRDDVVSDNCPIFIHRFYIAEDDCGNTATCSQVIFLDDTTPPAALVCPADIDLGCNPTFPDDLPPPAVLTSVDNCDGVITAELLPSDVVIFGCTATLIRYYRASDSCGNSVSCSQVITWTTDSTPPSITVPENSTVECLDDVVFEDPIVTDNCELAEVTYSDMSGTSFRAILSGLQEVPPNPSPALGTADGGIDTATNMFFVCVDFSGLIGPTAAAHVHIAPAGVNGPVIVPLPIPVGVTSGHFSHSAILTDAHEAALLAGGLYINIHTTVLPGGEIRGQLNVAECAITVKREWTATDACGNTSTACATVLVFDTTPPAPLVCPPAIDLGCNPEELPLPMMLTTVDNCSGVITAEVVPTIATIDGCQATLIRFYRATDDCGNSVSCSQVITWTVDTTPPSITCPEDFEIECGVVRGLFPPPNPQAVIAFDECSDYSVTWVGDVQVSQECGYRIVRTYRAEDACGNTSSCTQTFQFGDTQRPTIICPEDINAECGTLPAPDPGSVTAFDNCDPDVFVTWVSDETVQGGCALDVVRTYRAEDDCGNTSSCTQRIIVGDSEPPMISCPPDITVACVDESALTLYSVDRDSDLLHEVDPSAGATISAVTIVLAGETIIGANGLATHPVTNVLYALLRLDAQSGRELVTIDPSTGIASSIGNTGQPFAGIAFRANGVLYGVTGSGGSFPETLFTLSLADATPTLVLALGNGVDGEAIGYNPANDLMYHISGLGIDQVFESIDLDALTVTDITVSGDNFLEGLAMTYHPTVGGFLISDLASNLYHISTSGVVSEIGPLDELAKGLAFVGGSGPAPIVTDNCDESPFVTYVDVQEQVTCGIEITRTWIAEDDCGNISTCVQTIFNNTGGELFMTCTKPAPFFCPEELPTPEFLQEWLITEGYASASSECPGTQIIFTEFYPLDNGCALAWTFGFTAEDVCGNRADTCYIIVQLYHDDSAPEITCSNPPHLGCNPQSIPTAQQLISTGFVSASDSCGPVSLGFIPPFIQTNVGCEYSRQYRFRATDGCGNQSEICIVTINWTVDITPPSLTCPADLVLECTDVIPAPEVATATDDCELVLVTYVGEVGSGDSCDSLIVRTYYAIDACGNESFCTQQIRILDTTPPAIVCPGLIVLECGVDTVPVTSAAVSDNCHDFEVTYSDEEFPQICDGGVLVDGQFKVVTLIVRTFYAVDECDNASSCTQHIIIRDDTPPELSCPADITIQCDQDPNDLEVTGEPTVSDLCDPDAYATILIEFAEFESPCSTVIVRIWETTDHCGNGGSSELCPQRITIVDTEGPTIVCPADVTLECGTPLPMACPIVSDNCTEVEFLTPVTGALAAGDPLTRVRFTNVGVCSATACAAPGRWHDAATITITEPGLYTFSGVFSGDGMGGLYAGTFDPLNPCLNFVDGDDDSNGGLDPLLFACILVPGNYVLVSTSFACTNTAMTYAWAISHSQVQLSSVDSDPIGTCPMVIIRTHYATDDCGNVSSCTQRFTIVDTRPPVAMCPIDVTIECGDPLPTTLATGTDICGDVLVTYSDMVLQSVSTTVVFDGSVLNTAGNSAIPSAGTGGCAVAPQNAGGTTFNNIVSGLSANGDPVQVTLNLTHSFDSDLDMYLMAPNGQILELSTDNGSNGDHYTNTRFRDDGLTSITAGTAPFNGIFRPEGTTTVPVACGTLIQPTIATLAAFTNGQNGTWQLRIKDDANIDGGAMVSWSITFNDVEAITCGSLVKRTHVVTDECGNTSSCMQFIRILDTTPPTITCPDNVSIECGDPLPVSFATAADICDVDPFVTLISEVSTERVDGSCLYYVIRTFRAVDDCGNSSSCSQVITIEDTTAPELTCPDSYTIDCQELTCLTFDDVTVNPFGAPVDVSVINEGGITINVSAYSKFGIPRIPSLFDTENPHPAEVDLGTPNILYGGPGENEDDVNGFEASNNRPRGKAIVVQQHDSAYPDDHIISDSLVFNFSEPIYLVSLVAVDFESPQVAGGAGITMFDENGVVLNFVPFIGGPDNNVDNMILQQLGVKKLLVYYGNTVPASGGIANLCFVHVPKNIEEAIVSDNCNEIDVNCNEAVTILDACITEIVRTFSAIDECGNASASCTQTITIETDTEKPSIQCPADVIFECSSQDIVIPAPDPGSVVASDNCTASEDLIITWVRDIVDEDDCESVVRRVYSAEDECGNLALCVQFFRIVDTTPPSIACPADATIECGDDLPTTLATATDLCNEFSLTYSDSEAVGSCPMVVTRTHYAIDVCGNTASCTQYIYIEDTTAPEITCPFDIQIECGSPIPTQCPTVVDICSAREFVATISGTLTEMEVMDAAFFNGGCIDEWAQFTDGFCAARVYSVDNITITEPGYYVFTGSFDGGQEFVDGMGGLFAGSFDPNNPCENFTDGSDDTFVPDLSFDPTIIVCQLEPGDYSLVTTFFCESANADYEWTVERAAIELSYVDSAPEGECPMVITRTHFATDECGNTSSCTQNIYIYDTTPPSITCPEDLTLECVIDTIPTTLATAFDICDDAVDVTYVDVEYPQNCANDVIVNGEDQVLVLIVRTHYATDNCGNVASCTQRILIRDDTPPMVTCPENVTIECDQDPNDYELTGIPTLVDLCDPDAFATILAEFTSFASPCSTVITRVWIATDHCGNGGSGGLCPQLITIVDTTPPSITCPVDATVECGDDLPTTLATGTDNCNDVSFTYSDSEVTGECPQVIVRTHYASDACGNVSSCTQRIYIEDTTAPEISCPAFVTVECGDELPTTLATAVDVCTTDIDYTYSDANVVDGTNGCTWTVVRTHYATDNCGNVASCLQIILIVDTTPPTITCPGDVTIECDEIAGLDAATASDFCTDVVFVTLVEEQINEGTCLYTIVRTYRAEDECGNAVTCTQVITVEDTTPPEVSCPANVTLDCPSATCLTFDEFIVGADSVLLPTLVQGGITISITAWSKGGVQQSAGLFNTATPHPDDLDLGTPNVVYGGPGESNDHPDGYELTNNRPLGNILIVQQNNASYPNDHFLSDSIVFNFSEPVFMENVVVMDFEGPSNATGAGIFLFDADGNQISFTGFAGSGDDNSMEEVVLKKAGVKKMKLYYGTAIPSSGGIGSLCYVYVPCNAEEANASDACSEAIISCTDTTQIVDDCITQIIRTYSAEDECGNVNESACTQVLTLQTDGVQPEVMCPADLILLCGDPVPAPDPSLVSATDNCSAPADIAIVWIEDIVMGFGCDEEIRRIYQATDECGNIALCVQFITRQGPPVQLSARVLLGGSMSTGAFDMYTLINNLLPEDQPYFMPPASYPGPEQVNPFASNIVDWVLVELRDVVTMEPIGKRSALVTSTGDIVDLDGVSPLMFTATPDQYYVVICHRNHLDILSDGPVDMSGSIGTLDFTLGNNGMIQLGNGMWAMIKGDVNSDGLVNNTDLVLLAPKAAIGYAGQYLEFDVNMDGLVNNADLVVLAPFAAVGYAQGF